MNCKTNGIVMKCSAIQSKRLRETDDVITSTRDPLTDGKTSAESDHAKDGEHMGRSNMEPSVHHRQKPSNTRKVGELYKQRVADAALEWAMDNDWVSVEGRKVILRTWIYWNDGKDKDCHNTDKAWADALEGIIYDDDSQALIQYQDFEIDRANPRIEIEPVIGSPIIKDKPKRKKTTRNQMVLDL